MVEIQSKSDTLTEGRTATGSQPSADYVICRSTDKNDYSFWSFDIKRDPLLMRMPLRKGAQFDRTHQLIPIGKYLLVWEPLDPPGDKEGKFPYRLLEFDATSDHPLGANEVMSGKWKKKKFWGGKPDFGNPNGPAKTYDKGEKLLLLPLGTFILNVIPTAGRGTYKLFSFDPKRRDMESGDPVDPLHRPEWQIQGSFGTIEYGHELIVLGNYVLDRKPETNGYWLWSADPMNQAILARPAIQKGTWADIDENHQLTPIGGYVLDWDTVGGSYRLWSFDPTKSNPLVGPVKCGSMPPELEGKTMTLTGVQGLRRIDEKREKMPGTIDFMRTKIEHVVYYMLENRSFDHVCGWLYENGQQPNFIGPNDPFEGASEKLYNLDPDGKRDAKGNLPKVKLYRGSDEPAHDPYHDMTDTIRQCFSPYGENGDNRNGYAEGTEADMGGFVWSNGMKQVMQTFTPQTLPVLNGLAKHFAVSDKWFPSMPGATASQRAFSLTGSASMQLNNFHNNPQMRDLPYRPHRASIWKVLWANGFTDWKIYHAVKWPPRGKSFVYSYQLFLKKQIPTVDDWENERENLSPLAKEFLEKGGCDCGFIGGIDDFLKDAREGSLPRFSFLEPVWIALNGKNAQPATSYHPYGHGGTRPGEIALNEIYKALRHGKNWDKTLLIITFDEHGGFYDHVPPPRAANPWPNDENDGFRYDLMGVRVPTILVSPWIKENTVFRSTTKVPYDSTSILATLLHWYGIPKARWCMGDRTHYAPTFEGVFQEKELRTDTPFQFDPLPETKALADTVKEELDDLYDEIVPAMVEALIDERKSSAETSRIADEILEQATDVNDLTKRLDELAERFK